ncbi:vitamin K epoxide reductase family protein [Winogradskyella sp.]|uniref:vitamin K epoxide reductase family protein n=1 Tax=Winogradskyella sp. TaxID=1883156 RepID=UPI003BA9AA74
MRGSLLYVLKSFLKASDIKIDSDELKIQLLSHPSYPSLHALTGVLNHFGIPNAAVRLPVEPQILKELTPVFIAQIQSENSKDLVMVRKHAEAYEITYEEGRKENVSKAEFLQKFLGIVVVVEKESSAVDTVPKQNFKDYMLVFIVLALLFFQFLAHQPSFGSSVYLLLSFFGGVISFVIFKQEQGEATIIGDAFCNSSDEKKDCNSVLNSKGANIFKNFKLSDICIIYFIGSMVCIYLFQILNISYSLLYTISFLALPVTLYSIYYQKFIVKNWCALCLAIVAILWAQAGSVFLNSDFEFSIGFNDGLIALITYLSTVFIWNYISRLIKSRKELFDLKIENLRFKKNFDLFKSALLSSDAVDTHIPIKNEMKFGNSESQLKIVVVTNPFCGHCKAVHTLIEDILEKHNEAVEITVRFNVNIDQKDSQVVAITSRIIELYDVSGDKTCLNAMHDIYGELKAEAWIEKWGTCENLDKSHDILQKSRDWCSSKALNFTPAILINGRAYPKAYNRPDLIYFIEELDEDLEEVLELQDSMA